MNYMRYLDRLIASEVLPNAYKEWRGYRQKLTDFIEENCVAEGGGKPVLAIWGAGRSNDIDLARLAERFKLVLIDRDAEGLVQRVRPMDWREQMLFVWIFLSGM